MESKQHETEPAVGEVRRRRWFHQEAKPKQYIRDRCYGVSKYHPEAKPPCYICYVPNCTYWFSNALEQNKLCEVSGRIGLVDHDEPRVRRKIFSIGLFANLVALFLTFFACFAISVDYNILRAASFSKGVIRVPSKENQIEMSVGLRAIAFSDTKGIYGPAVVPFGEFCKYYNGELHGYVRAEQCSKCEEKSTKLVSSVIVSLLLVFPSITTDVLRMFPNYDVNCQKFYGSIVSTLSMFFSLVTFLLYNNDCFSSFYNGAYLIEVSTNSSSAVARAVATINPSLNGTDVEIDFDWDPGNALICMYVATSLKLIDIVANLIVPTPTITRDRDEQLAYEALVKKEDKDDDEDNEEDEEEGNDLETA